MVNRIEIERLLQNKELKELWQTIQQELPQLHFYEEEDSTEEARIDYLEDYISECNTLLRKSNLQEMSIKDLYIYLSSDSFEAFCKQDFWEYENTEIIIDESERDYILNELEMSEDEYKQGCKMYDYLHIAENLIDYHWRLLKSVNAKLLNSVFMLVTRFSGLQTLSHFSNDYIGVGALKLGSPIFHECRTIHFQPDC